MTQKDIITKNLDICDKACGHISNKDEAHDLIDRIQNYEGWGRCTNIIDTRSEEYKTAYQTLTEQGYEKFEIEETISKIQTSALTSFYTPTGVAKTIMHYALDKYKELNGKPAETILDPSCGAGAFLTDLENYPEQIEVYACEKDEVTNHLLKMRMRAMNVLRTNPCSRFMFPTFAYEQWSNLTNVDVIVSNMPFGQVSVYDKSMERLGGVYRSSQKMIHNYYFMKSLQLLRDGGIMAFITTRGFLSSPKNEPYRDEMLKHGSVLNIVRLPDNLFPTVDVGSDLIVYQKNDNYNDNDNLCKLFLNGWDEQAMPDIDDINQLRSTVIPHTDWKVKKNQYGKYVVNYRYFGDDMATDLRSCLYGIRCTRAEHHDNKFYFYFE